jgi:hypothetical protein
VNARRSRIALYTIAAAIIFLAAAVVVAPGFVDWNRYKPEVAAAAAALTGRDVVIEGDVSFEFLPAPVLRVDDVRVSNPAGFGGGEIARAGAVHLSVSLFALIAGRIEVGKVTVVRPLLTLEILPDGRRNWLSASATVGRAVEKGAMGAFAFPSTSLDLSVESAFVIFRDDRSGYVQTLEHLDITVSGAATDGPYRAVGRFELRDRPIAFDGSLGSFGEGGKAPVRIALWRREIAARIRFTGDIDTKLADPVLTGTVRGGGEDFLAFVAEVAGFDQARAPDVLGEDFDFEADIQVNGSTAAFDKLSIVLGEFRAAGAGEIRLTRPAVAELALAVEAVNLDRLFRGRGSAARASISGLPQSLAGVDEIIENILTELGPDKVSLHLTLGALIHNGGIARDLLLDAELESGEMSINQFFVRLPGAAELSVAGLVGLEDGEPHFEGIIDATGSNLRGTLDWLGIDNARVPPDRLRKFAVTSRFAATPDMLRFEDVSLDLDVSRIAGRVSIEFPQKRAYDADLTVDEIDLSAYLPGPALGGSEEYDARFVVRVGQMRLFGATLERTRVDASFVEDVLTIHELGFGHPRGVRARITGNVSGFGIAPVFDLSLDIDATQASGLWSMFGASPPVWAAQLGPLAARGQLTGQLASAQLNLETDTAGARLRIDGGLRLSLSGPRYEFDLVGSHPNLLLLGRRFDPHFGEALVIRGGASVAATVTGDLASAKISKLTANLGSASARGAAMVDFSGAVPRVSGRIEAGTLDLGVLIQDPVAAIASGSIPPVAPPSSPAASDEDGKSGGTSARQIWPLTPIKIPHPNLDAAVEIIPEALVWREFRVENPKLQLVLTSAGVAIRRLSGEIFGGELEMSAWLNGRQKLTGGARLALRGGDAGAALGGEGSYTLAGGKFDVEVALDSNGLSPHELISNLAGRGRIEMVGGTFRDFDLEAVNRKTINRNRQVGAIELFIAGEGEGDTSINSASGTFGVENGVIHTSDLAIQAVGGVITADGAIDLMNRDVKATIGISLSSVPDAPPLEVGFEGPADDPDTDYRFDAFQEYLLRTTREPPPNQGER